MLLAERHQHAIAEQRFPTDQLILVTFTRSAAANLKAKIRSYLRELSAPLTGFAVYTLHGLALTIATRHPQLSGLSLDRLTLVSPNQSNRLIRTAVEQWIAANSSLYQQLLVGRQFDGEETERLRRQSVLRTEVLPDLAYTVIHEAKSSGLLPEALREIHLFPAQSREGDVEEYPIMAIAAGLYEQYQTLLQLRGFIDYDDMILAALKVLNNESARQLWQKQVFAVFEDEAQDSSPLQTRLLEILAADPIHPDQPLNLVRVGDPNQAINSTFTPADPVFFRQFCETCAMQGRLAEMNQAGRSTTIIMDAANFMLDWVNQRYGRQPIIPSSTEGRYASVSARASATLASGAFPLADETPFRPQTIYPVATGDPQPDANPAAEGQGLEIRFPPDIFQTAELIGQRVVELLGHNPDGRAAVLVRENRQGKWLADRLSQLTLSPSNKTLPELGIAIYEVGQSDRQSHVPGEMLTLLQFLDRPHSPDYLKAALKVMVDRQRIPTQDLNLLTSLPEQFLYPGPLDAPLPDPVVQAQRYCTGLLHARLELPPHQLIPFLALTLKYDQSELATADKLAERIHQQTAGDRSLVAILDALTEIVQSERFEPVETDDAEARYTRSSQLTIITMHKAKGLDWDFVFIPFLHDHVIPGRPWIPPQAQFLGDFNLAEVARAQIRAYLHEQTLPDTVTAWERANYLKTAEEFRLLYVAMTRAKRLLWMSAAHKAPFTWSKPENLDDRLPCPVLPALAHQFPR
jgi:DNA helicase-2/ATP-dependent DNA helicase PcrA